MKWMGIVMVFVGCVLFGLMLDTKYRMRIKELRSFIQGFERLKGEIEYHLTPLAEGCIEASRHLTNGVGHVFRQFGCDLENRKSLDTYKLWQETIAKEKYRYHLADEDYELLYDFGRRVGNMDKNMQQQNIEFMIKRLTHSVENLEKNAEKTSKMNTGLSILVGACICILLI